MIKNSILDMMGNTPIVRLQNMWSKSNVSIFVKVEGFNPGGSHKARVALNMILEAENDGRLRRGSGQTIIEPTGGNTGIGLALAGAVLGYKVLLVVPDNYSAEKQRILRAYGAEVVISHSSEGSNSHIELVWNLLVENPAYVFLNQFSNTANVDAHRKGTALEILKDMDRLDYFICGIGTGGSITGIAEILKKYFPDLIVIGVQPEGCDILKNKFISHDIQGLAVGICPDILNTTIIDEMISVTSENAVKTMKRLAREEGLLLGISSGANIYCALQIAREIGLQKNILTIAPDFGSSYLDYF